MYSEKSKESDTVGGEYGSFDRLPRLPSWNEKVSVKHIMRYGNILRPNHHDSHQEPTQAPSLIDLEA